MELKRVVVTGLGAITPLGNTLPETWEGIINGKSGAGPITQFDASKFKTQFACEVKGFDPLTVMDRKEARKCDRYSLFAINAAKQAIDDAAMDLDKEDKNRIGVIFASGIGGIKTFDEEVLGYAKIKDTIGPKFNPFFIPKMISDIAAGHISMLYGFHGPNFATVSACASSTNAISDAFTRCLPATIRPKPLPVRSAQAVTGLLWEKVLPVWSWKRWNTRWLVVLKYIARLPEPACLPMLTT